MKKLIPLLLAALCLTSCAEQKEIENPDTLRAAVIGSSDSVSARNAYSLLGESTAAALTVDMVDMSDPSALSEYDIFYIDKSAVDLPSFDAKVIEPLVSDGGASAVLDNELYNYFDYDFVGASEFVSVNGCPVDMEYPAADRDTQKIQELISDFCKLYKNYSDFDTLSQLDYGVGVVPSTAQCIAVKDGAGIYTINQYGNGYVFFTNPLLPNIFSVNNLSPEDKGEYLSATTVGANKLLRDYIAEFVSMKKYGYSTELIIGNYGSPAASWECHYEDITGIENGSAEIFEEMCENYGQVPSFTLVRNPYVWFRRAESVTYAVNDNGAFAMDPYENAYSSGTHFVSSKKWLSLAYDDNTISYFLESPDYTKRAYPCPVDFNGDGVMDLICGSSDGVLYYYEGYGMKTNYELSASTVFTNGEGDPISVGEYSSPQTADINLDGEDEIICGSAEGLIRCFARTDKDSMVLEDLGVIINTGLVDSMPAAGDLNGDGMTDIAVGSRGGDLRIYYGTLGVYGVEYNDFVTVESGQV